MSCLRCPVCQQTLIKQENRFCCTQGHSFDQAVQGYVNLIRSQKKIHGDNKEMVLARTRFLQAGHYEPLRDQLFDLLSQAKASHVLDCGCGEGYYTQLATKLKTSEFYGLDLSKEALKVACRHVVQVHFVAASSFELPFFDESFDFLWSCFAPYQLSEISRVVKKEGLVVLIGPGPSHLFELKEKLYDKPYLNPVIDVSHPDFTQVQSIELGFPINLTSQQSIQDLLMMTPYYYKTSLQDKEKITSYNEMTITTDFILRVLKKK